MLKLSFHSKGCYGVKNPYVLDLVSHLLNLTNAI